jgi:hypothetical protein
MAINLANYKRKARDSVKAFWGNREAARQKQIEAGKADQGERAAVTAGKNMDGFIALMIDLVEANGLGDAGRTGGQAASGTQTGRVKTESISCRSVSIVLRPGDYDGCHSEEQCDKESRSDRNNARFFAFTPFRLRMTVPQIHMDGLLECPGFNNAVTTRKVDA